MVGDLKVEGMSCGHCVRALQDELTKLGGLQIENISVGEAKVRFDPAKITREMLANAVTEAGFELKQFSFSGV